MLAPRDFNSLMQQVVDYSGFSEKKIRSLKNRALTTISLEQILRDMQSGKIATPRKKEPPGTPPKAKRKPFLSELPDSPSKERSLRKVRETREALRGVPVPEIRVDVAPTPRDMSHAFHRAVSTPGTAPRDTTTQRLATMAKDVTRGASFPTAPRVRNFPTAGLGRNTIGDTSIGGGFSKFSPQPPVRNRPINAGKDHIETMLSQGKVLSFGTPARPPTPQAQTPHIMTPQPGPQTPAGGDPYATPAPPRPDPRPARLAPELSPIAEGAGGMDIQRAGKRSRSASITGSPGRSRRAKIDLTPPTPQGVKSPEVQFLTPAMGAAPPPPPPPGKPVHTPGPVQTKGADDYASDPNAIRVVELENQLREMGAQLGGSQRNFSDAQQKMAAAQERYAALEGQVGGLHEQIQTQSEAHADLTKKIGNLRSGAIARAGMTVNEREEWERQKKAASEIHEGLQGKYAALEARAATFDSRIGDAEKTRVRQESEAAGIRSGLETRLRTASKEFEKLKTQSASEIASVRSQHRTLFEGAENAKKAAVKAKVAELSRQHDSILAERLGAQKRQFEEHLEATKREAQKRHTEALEQTRTQTSASFTPELERLRADSQKLGLIRGERGALLEENAALKARIGRQGLDVSERERKQIADHARQMESQRKRLESDYQEQTENEVRRAQHDLRDEFVQKRREDEERLRRTLGQEHAGSLDALRREHAGDIQGQLAELHAQHERSAAETHKEMEQLQRDHEREKNNASAKLRSEHAEQIRSMEASIRDASGQSQSEALDLQQERHEMAFGNIKTQHEREIESHNEQQERMHSRLTDMEARGNDERMRASAEIEKLRGLLHEAKAGAEMRATADMFRSVPATGAYGAGGGGRQGYKFEQGDGGGASYDARGLRGYMGGDAGQQGGGGQRGGGGDDRPPPGGGGGRPQAQVVTQVPRFDPDVQMADVRKQLDEIKEEGRQRQMQDLRDHMQERAEMGRERGQERENFRTMMQNVIGRMQGVAQPVAQAQQPSIIPIPMGGGGGGVIHTVGQQQYPYPPPAARGDGVKVITKQVVNERSRRRKAATKDTKRRKKKTKSEYQSVKKAVQTRVRKLRAEEFKKLSAKIAKIPRGKRKAAREVVRKRLMNVQKSLFSRMTLDKMDLKELKKLVSKRIKF